MLARVAQVQYVTTTIVGGIPAFETAVLAALRALAEAELLEPLPPMHSDGTNYIQPIWYTQGS